MNESTMDGLTKLYVRKETCVTMLSRTSTVLNWACERSAHELRLSARCIQWPPPTSCPITIHWCYKKKPCEHATAGRTSCESFGRKANLCSRAQRDEQGGASSFFLCTNNDNEPMQPNQLADLALWALCAARKKTTWGLFLPFSCAFHGCLFFEMVMLFARSMYIGGAAAHRRAPFCTWPTAAHSNGHTGKGKKKGCSQMRKRG